MKPILRACMVAYTLWLSAIVHAEFAVAISPPRFVLEAKPGEVLRQTVEITNAAGTASTYSVKTADWNYGPDGSVTFSEDLTTGSCRPWVGIERRQLTVQPRRPYRFRFEIAAPAGTLPVECRFALLIEGEGEKADAGGISVPFAARMAVIVYVGVGGVQPELSVVGAGVRMVDGLPTPVLQVRNQGRAHGRLAGFLSGVDANKTNLDATPADSPILPGEERSIPLLLTRRGDADTRVAPQFPLTIKGRLELGKDASREFEQRFDR